MKIPLPKRLVDRLIRQAVPTPYFHLSGYMNRWWAFGAASIQRNDDNPHWKIDGDGRRTVPPINVTLRGPLYQFITRLVAARVHRIMRGDIDRHLHDHPSWNISIVLKGGFFEVMPMFKGDPIWCGGVEAVRSVWRGPGSIVIRRKATARHRLELPYGEECWTLFIIGKKSNEWGFYTEQGKIPHAEYFRNFQ